MQLPTFSFFLLHGPYHWLTVELIPSEPPRCNIRIFLMGCFMPELPIESNFISDHTWGREQRRGHPDTPCCFSKSTKHIDNPKSYLALALANVASLSSDKSSEDSLQQTIETDCGWIHQKKKLLRNTGLSTTLTGWWRLGWEYWLEPWLWTSQRQPRHTGC